MDDDENKNDDVCGGRCCCACAERCMRHAVMAAEAKERIMAEAFPRNIT
jgi:hypothetical protein